MGLSSRSGKEINFMGKWVGDRSRGAGHNGGDGDGDGYQGALVVSHTIEGEWEHARL